MLSGEVLLCPCRGGEKCHADVLMKLHDERDVLSLRAALPLKVALPDAEELGEAAKGS